MSMPRRFCTAAPVGVGSSYAQALIGPGPESRLDSHADPFSYHGPRH
ncbi:hypothetical protein [Nocardia panacis]|nr:hypothetical protein [Nocardia panacis]